MTRRELKKNAYRIIVKENRSHQDAFDELRKNAANGPEELAEDLAKIPSGEKQKQNQVLIYVYVALLVVVLLLRVIGITFTFGMMEININMLLILVALGIIVPAAGIFGALTRRQDSYRTVAILLLIGVGRAVSRGEVGADPFAMIWLTPILIAAGLAFYIPTRLKTNFTKKIVTEESEGTSLKKMQITFENEQALSPDLLDANL